MLENPAEIHDDFTVGIVVSDVLNDEDFRSSISEYRKSLVAKEKAYEQEMPESAKTKPHVSLAFARTRHLLDAEIR